MTEEKECLLLATVQFCAKLANKTPFSLLFVSRHVPLTVAEFADVLNLERECAAQQVRLVRGLGLLSYCKDKYVNGRRTACYAPSQAGVNWLNKALRQIEKNYEIAQNNF